MQIQQCFKHPLTHDAGSSIWLQRTVLVGTAYLHSGIDVSGYGQPHLGYIQTFEKKSYSLAMLEFGGFY